MCFNELHQSVNALSLYLVNNLGHSSDVQMKFIVHEVVLINY